MKLAQAIEYVGGFSAPSKMPCHGFSIPARYCKTGQKLRDVAGSICSKCYALKGRYGFPNVQNALERRFANLKNDLWVQAMTIAIRGTESSGFFRWHDSGDIQSLDHLKKIFQVCKLTPDVNHWLPTREASIMKQVTPEEVPVNLIIRLSATKVDGLPSTFWPYTSSVVTENKTCPAAEQDNKCLSCRTCWDKSIPNVAYGKH